MAQVEKRLDGIFVPKELIADFEHAEVDTSHPHAIVIRSSARKKESTALLARIDKRRVAIQARRGTRDDSSAAPRRRRNAQ